MKFKLTKHHKAVLIYMLIGISLLSCSTKKTAFVSTAYHGITTRYNIYFNGRESFKEAKSLLMNDVKDNYTDVLQVYVYPEKVQAMTYAPQWDRTIEKCSKAITKHSILVKGIEHCKPIDDTYLLMGQAYFYRQDYYDALRIFSYIINTHNNGNVWPDAYTWKAKTNLQLNRLDDAEESLEQIRQKVLRHKNKQFKNHWEAVIADKFIRQKEYELAANHLAELEEARFLERDFKTRVLFILGQIYQKLEQPEVAEKKYNKVLKRNPPYEMEFNATLNMLMCATKAKSEAKNKLVRLLKDPRNEEYKDQIFYVLARMDFKNQDTLVGIRNLEASVFWSINNKYQKTVSALELAEYYFEQTNYVESQQYYDTVLAIIPSTFPDYNEIKHRAGILKELVEHLMIIKTQDSLQRMARMSPKELDMYLNEVIANYEKAEAERIADEEEKALLMESSKKSNTGRKSSWVFYDATQAKLGEQEFRKRWGKRVLEDNWFISDKSSMMMMVEETPDEENLINENEKPSDEKKVNVEGTRISDPTQKQYYMQDLPKTEEDFEVSNELITAAMYNAGFVYYDELNDKNKAAQLWTSLIKRFPNHNLEAPTAFQLYKTYTYLQDNEQSAYYKNLILTKYPETDYAKIIENPNYYEEIEKKRKEAQTFYTNLYDLYENEKYNQVIDEAEKGLQNYQNPSIRKNMHYLKAISKGKVYGNDTLKNELMQVVANYPTTDIDTLAKGVLEALKRLETQSIATHSQTDTLMKAGQVEEVFYRYDASKFHFVIIVTDIKELKIDKLKLDIHNFNKEFFRMYTFDISSFYIDNTLQMLTISRFENKEKAMEYYLQMKINQTHLSDLNMAKRTTVYVISDDNYTIFYKNKQKRPAYDEFFNTYYLDK
ncbi:MAG: tetratricopeptide repeat protein [Bacteroidales bacterium]|nr:tetratricopeptide repeat protein [Bacteroidales bacterium]MDD3329917.1 tetratricopeptide repeat protein [Bacteroidales bacterium]MDD3691164.1 tetratricopeptide repeat protein [Bacteroidales bacterium]MDD4044175.1 tetratricopeptide repeat protein [Bacteroidales bacterium]NLO43158.1 tetratricopeptide repeat protein [Bacteroidales bacterium]